MPRVVIPKRTKENTKNSLLSSGNLDYFVRYGLALVKSHLENNNGTTSLIINCVDFTLTTAINLLTKYFQAGDLDSVYLIKTDLKSLGPLTPDQRLSYLKTIRFYVAACLRKEVDCNLIICDIDSLITSNNFSHRYQDLVNSGITLGIGSTNDYLNLGLYNAGKLNYLWRTVKAGFTFFKKGTHGTETLQRISHCLFNYEDPIPPIDDLKLYRAYYGDQLAIFFTSLEFNSAGKDLKHNVSCIGHKPNQIVTFGDNPSHGSIWIPPASKRVDDLFELKHI